MFPSSFRASTHPGRKRRRRRDRADDLRSGGADHGSRVGPNTPQSTGTKVPRVSKAEREFTTISPAFAGRGRSEPRCRRDKEQQYRADRLVSTYSHVDLPRQPVFSNAVNTGLLIDALNPVRNVCRLACTTAIFTPSGWGDGHLASHRQLGCERLPAAFDFAALVCLGGGMGLRLIALDYICGRLAAVGTLSSAPAGCKLARRKPEGRNKTMPIEPMLTEETPASALVARVLEEAGIEMVFGISGRPYRPHRVGPQQLPELDPHTVLPGREEFVGWSNGGSLRPADPASRRLAQAGAVGARQRTDRHHRGAFIEFAGCCC